MGYLDNSTITVDAILTKRGRELLAMGRGTANGFQITQFALADDEIDYDLWNPAHPLGSAYYGAVIENMPVTEAVPDETQSMKYKLITLPRGAAQIPYLQSTKSSIEVKTSTDPSNFVEIRTYFTGTPGTNKADNIFNRTAGYTAILLDTTYITMAGDKGTTTVVPNPPSPTMPATSLTAILTPPSNDTAVTIKFTSTARGKELDPTVTKSTKLIVTGNETGGRVVIPITFVNDITATTVTI
jgi:hypothetical protein